jgi:hypothetical protein
MSDLGWQFWSDAKLDHQVKGIRIFHKDGYYCICEPGIEPGDAECYIRGSFLGGYAVFWQLVTEGEFHPDTLTTLDLIQ